MYVSSPIRCATALSLAGHGALFLIFGAYNFLPGDVESVPTLTLTVNRDNGRDSRQESAPRNPREIELGPAEKPVTALVADDRPSELSPNDDTKKNKPTQTPPASGDESSGALETVASNSPEPSDATDIVTTTGESDY